jgi:hypothetical protein
VQTLLCLPRAGASRYPRSVLICRPVLSLPLPRKEKAPSIVGRGLVQDAPFRNHGSARRGLCRVCQLYRPGRGSPLRKRLGVFPCTLSGSAFYSSVDCPRGGNPSRPGLWRERQRPGVLLPHEARPRCRARPVDPQPWQPAPVAIDSACKRRAQQGRWLPCGGAILPAASPGVQ